MEKERFYSKEWIEKRKRILKRDNFTCQNCNTFNPSLGMVQYYRHDDSSLELHEYESSPGLSLYRLTSHRTGITLEMDFGLNWLVLPILQVHHKRYIEDRQIWDYKDSDLVTLCRDCHTKGHEAFDIPLFNSDGKIVQKKKFAPEDEIKGTLHDYVPWIFVNMDYTSREYKVASVQATLGIFLLSTEFDKIDKLREDALLIYIDFMEVFLPRMNNGIFYVHD